MKIFISALVSFLLLGMSFSNSQTNQPIKFRQPAVAGSFYPADKKTLSKMIDGFLSLANPDQQKGQILGLVVPHAGYVFSGPVAAQAYKTLIGREINRVIVVAPSHVEYFKGASVYNGSGYLTPLGKTSVDRAFAEKLVKSGQHIFLSGRGHDIPKSGRAEHALEVQLPFLQRVCGNFELVPIVMGEQSYETCRELGRAIAQNIKDRNTLIIASSDLSHFHPYDEAVIRDQKVVNAILEGDYFNLSRNLRNQTWEACGGGPIVATMIAVEQLGAGSANLLKYANSADVPQGDRSRVVGYAALSFVKPDKPSKKSQKSFQLNKTSQKQLLTIARASVEKITENGETFEPDIPDQPELLTDRGVFVTLKINSRLRGCIGFTAPLKPLYLMVRDAAIRAATADPRFLAVRKNELNKLSYEISVLSPFGRALDINDIEVGVHGLLIKKGSAAGLLLPQVPVEQKWNKQEFLEQTCRKAGLAINAWQEKSCDIFKFTAFVFGDQHDPGL